ncbi:unnamed protein product [Cuscuta europaea]|uniref:Uncharacterized protein n=1 Tax=Cuscuta europaea TaxID=41803 RepID=A0A9P1EN41_CUSEU|nr:unnamed protein product [Cuscuta europaea]
MTFTSNFRQFQERQPEMEREAERRLRDLVVLVPCPFQGHVTPILQLGHVLHSKGFSITVAHARCNAPDPSNHPEFSFQGLGHSLSINLDGIIKASDIGLKGRLETIYDMNENCRVPLQEYLEEKGDVVSCIIYDNLMFFFDQVAALLNLPSIVLRPSSAAYFPVLLHVLEHEDTLSSIPESRLEDPILKFHPIRYQDMSIVFRQSEEAQYPDPKPKISSPIDGPIIQKVNQLLGKYVPNEVRIGSHIWVRSLMGQIINGLDCQCTERGSDQPVYLSQINEDSSRVHCPFGQRVANK